MNCFLSSKFIASHFYNISYLSQFKRLSKLPTAWLHQRNFQLVWIRILILNYLTLFLSLKAVEGKKILNNYTTRGYDRTCFPDQFLVMQ